MGRAVQGCRPFAARIGLCLFALWTAPALAQHTLTVAAFPSVDEIVRAAAPAWQALHPTVRLQVASRQFADHHTAMTTALSTSSYLPDVMALEVGYVGRFARGGGLADLSQPPYDIAAVAARFVLRLAQGSNREGRIGRGADRHRLKRCLPQRPAVAPASATSSRARGTPTWPRG